MKISPKYIILVSATVVVFAVAFFTIKHFSSRPSFPYPSLDKQRAALVNKPFVNPTRVLDSTAIVNDLRYLASDTCEGRRPGSVGYERAVERILARMREAGLDSFNNSLIQTFSGKPRNHTRTGKNIIGWIKGTRYPEKYIVISAHYDHLGKVGDTIYYGASDNASGTACILAMAEYFKQNPLPCSLIFAAFDREEAWMEGSVYFVDNLPSPLHLSDIRMNLNIDMITRNDSNEIFVSGIYHNPSLIYAVNEIQNQTNAKVLMGHDTGNDREDWTYLSDHSPFHRKKISFLYLGVEDHVDYHKPTDTYDKTNFSMYIENCNMIALLLKVLKP
jgi:hypothetical protein